MASINQQVWKMKYGVTDAQLASSAWLNADDDGDGIKNGDELAAGTNPFSAAKTIKVSNISQSSGNVTLQFPTEDGKRYRTESTTTLSNSASWVLQPQPTPTVIVGDGTTKSLTIPYVANSFYRIHVDDMDSSNSGVSDWAKKLLGYNPNSAMTDGRTPDGTAIPAALALLNQVTVTATKASATQPPDSLTAPVDIGSVTVSRGIAKLGSITAPAITVNLQKTGTAGEGSDYDALPPSVSFPAGSVAYLSGGGANQAVFSVNPRYNGSRKTNVTAIVKALAGTGYTLGSANSASVVVNPAGSANGAGLTGQYFNTSSSTYSPNQTNIYSGSVQMTRTDATVDFANAVNGWGVTGGPVGMSPASANTAFSVRWTGQILPQYSETYTFDFRSDDGAKVWVNGVLLIDKWVSQGATDWVNTISLQANVLYDIQIDYYNGSGNAEAHLYWWSPSQAKQIIPQSRLFPVPALSAKVTALTSNLTAVGYVSVPFSFNVSTPNIGGTVSYALDVNSGPLPPGLSLNGSTGAITGTPTAAGTYNVAINATNAAAAAITGSSIVNFTIYPAGSVTRETLAANGTITADGTIATLDDDTDYPNNTSRRLRGYIVPPKTGNYYFWLASNNTAELWISNDSEYVNRVRRATVTASTGKKVWNAASTQQTQWLALVAGQKYYFDVLHNTGADADSYVAMGWCQDDLGTVPSTPASPNPTGATPLIPNGGAALQGYALSGTIPGYIFQPYDYPSATSATGTLYSADLGPQGSAGSQASGSANLRVDSSGTFATLHFNYQNLTSPRTAYHLHTDTFIDGSVTHPQGEIIYDIDAEDALHPEDRTADGGYVWHLNPVGSFTNAAQIMTAIQQGHVYLNVHSVNFPSGEIRGNLNLVSGSQVPPDPTAYAEPTGTDVATNATHAARFLNQASFGASPADVSYVGSHGFAGWFTNQLTQPASHSSGDAVNIGADINQLYPSSNFTNAWWKYSINGPDQLRQRLAFALSEIMVASWANDSGPLAFNGRILADYYDQFVDYSLPTAGLTDSGNFRGVLKAVTLTPAMGLYLNMLGNQKGDDSLGRHPNENYAREIMQLFSVGLNKMWDDGKFMLDSSANLVPTYNQNSILGMSALLTGWHYSQQNLSTGRAPTNFGPAADYLNPMVLVPPQHDLNAKLLLNNVVTTPATGRAPRIYISSISTGAPACTITTAVPHGLTTGDTVTVCNVVGGTFGSTVNATFRATVLTPTTFTIPVACTVAPTANTGLITGATVTALSSSAFSISGIAVGNPCTVTTTAAHGLRTGDTVVISSVTKGTYTGGLTAINASFVATVTSTTAFTVPVECTALATSGGTVTGTLAGPGVNTTGIVPFAGSQSDTNGVQSPHPYDTYGLTELDIAINNIVNNDNVPPYICRQLIQRFVTSNPSPGYLYRVVQKFKNNGSGVRGDMVAVMQQILLDGEARSTPALSNTSFGKQREPVLRLTAPARAFPATSYTGTYTQLTTTSVNKLRIVTSAPNDFSTSFTVSLNFQGNYTTTSPPNPYTNPTSTTYTVSATLGIANTTTDLSAIDVTSPARVHTVQPHGLATGNAVIINSVTGGTFSAPLTTQRLITYVDANTFDVQGVNCTVAPTSVASAKMISNPCKITTVGPHGLATGNVVTISGTTGTFSPTIIGTPLTVTVVDSTSFTVVSNCTVASAVNTGSIVGANTLDVSATGMTNATYSQPAAATITNIAAGNPTTITTSAAHGLLVGSTVTISGLTDGTFSPAINGTFTVNTVPSGTTFTVLSNCTVAPTTYAGAKSAGNVLTINTAGPQTAVTVPGTTVNIASIAPGANPSTDPCVVTTSGAHNLVAGGLVSIAGVTDGTFGTAITGTFIPTVTGTNTFTVPVSCTVAAATGTSTKLIRSKVYAMFLSQTSAGGAAQPTDGVYEVQTTPTNSFTIFTPDTPATARGGNVIIPKIGTSYTPQSSNTIVQFNNNSNHNMQVGQNVWMDAPVVVTPLTDGEYTITAISDEDHFTTSYLPANLNGGTYPKPSGSNNGATFYPLVPPPTGRSGTVVISQSTYALGTTESTLTQSPLNAPTVFNFFSPTYRFPGALANGNLDGPEFQLTTDTNVMTLTNSLTNMFIGSGGGNGNVNGLSSFNNGSGNVVMDIGSYMNTSYTLDANIPVLVDALSSLLVGYPLDTGTRATIISFVANTTNFPMSGTPTNQQMRDRVRAVIQLIITSAEYAVQK